MISFYSISSSIKASYSIYDYETTLFNFKNKSGLLAIEPKGIISVKISVDTNTNYFHINSSGGDEIKSNIPFSL